jgi:hypothetical protein
VRAGQSLQEGSSSLILHSRVTSSPSCHLGICDSSLTGTYHIFDVQASQLPAMQLLGLIRKLMTKRDQEIPILIGFCALQKALGFTSNITIYVEGESK